MRKLKTIIKQGVKQTADAFQEGYNNYNNPTSEIEQEAIRRANICKDCLVDEPISFLKVKDERIPKLNNKIFECCGCSAAYKARQNVTKCDKWEN